MRSVLLYVGFVGAPLLLLIGILNVGAGITAPRAIGGTWELASPITGPIATCMGLGSPEGGRALRVSQSGAWSQITLEPDGGFEMSAELDDTRLVGSMETDPAADCPGGPLDLAASVNTGVDRAEMTGTLTLTRCAACGPLQFRAVRGVSPP